MSYKEEVNPILEKGAKAYAAKKYEDAVELFGDACEKASALNNGEEDPDLLFLYGKALFQVAVSKNGLFGGADEQEQQENGEEQKEEEEDEQLKKGKESGMFQFSEDVPLAEEDEDEDEGGEGEEEKEEQKEGKEEPEEEQEQEENKEGEEKQEEQTDFEIAWEILDLSRSLFETKLKELEKDNQTKSELLDNPESSKDELIQTKIKLSELHDLLGEISLETENFKQAVEDFKELLQLREGVFPFKHNLISEAHYKLSLALEFDYENEESKKDSIHHLKQAIESIKQRPEQDDELIKELQLKLEELSRDPNEQLKLQKEEILRGILGEPTSSDNTAATSITSSTVKPVINDLTSVVKKRKPKPKQPATNKRPKNQNDK